MCERERERDRERGREEERKREIETEGDVGEQSHVGVWGILLRGKHNAPKHNIVLWHTQL